MSATILVIILLALLSGGLGAIIFLVVPRMRRAESALESCRAESARQDERCQQYQARTDELEGKFEEANRQVLELSQEKAKLQTRLESELKQLEAYRRTIDEMRESLKLEFENLANRIFVEKSESFNKSSGERIGGLINPLQEQLGKFEKRMEESFGVQRETQASLKQQLEMLASVSKSATEQAENLSKALSSDMRQQGEWGEIVLEHVLESSGLRKGQEYDIQQSSRAEDGRVVRPDVVVKLPENRNVIIDSKVTLNSYRDYVSAEDETVRAEGLKAFQQSVREHVKRLGSQDYQHAQGFNSPDFVLMFMPIEGAFMLALTKDNTLFFDAWQQGIALVCPTTLLAMLRCIESIWRLDKQNRNIQEILKIGAGLYDKIAGFVEDMEKLGKQLETSRTTYEKSMNKLSHGQGSILKRTENMRQLGVRSSKRLDSDLIESD